MRILFEINFNSTFNFIFEENLKELKSRESNSQSFSNNGFKLHFE